MGLDISIFAPFAILGLECVGGEALSLSLARSSCGHHGGEEGDDVGDGVRGGEARSHPRQQGQAQKDRG